MKIALYLNPQTSGADQDANIIRSETRAAVDADRAGFSAIWLTEHHFANYNTYGDSIVFGASLIPQLERAWVVLTVVTLALHNPIRFVEQCNILDQLAEGRFIAGYGAGGSGVEFAGFGRSVDERHALMLENLEIAEQAWALESGQPPLEYSTTHEQGTVLGRIMPTSHRCPHPLLGRGTLSDEGIVDVARRGHVFFMGRIRPDQAERQLELYRKELDAAGHSDQVIADCLEHAGPVRMLFVAPTDEEAFHDVQAAVDGYLAYSRSARPADRGERKVVGTSPVFSEKEDLLERAIIWGSPQTVVQKLKEFEAVGLRQFTTWFNWGGMNPQHARRSLDLFIEGVLPHFERMPEQEAAA